MQKKKWKILYHNKNHALEGVGAVQTDKVRSEKKPRPLGRGLIHKENKKSVMDIEKLTGILLRNRKIRDEKSFFNPIYPQEIDFKSLGIKKNDIQKTIDRLKEAKKEKEKIIIYGDYDADGICSTAILWETLYKKGFDVLPYIPERFSEGYGLNSDTVEKLKVKDENLKVILAVDNGVVAYEAVEKANKLGIDVIVFDHHRKEKKLPNAYSLIHSDLVCGSTLAYLFSKEFSKDNSDYLSLACIGTVADQMPLIDINRSIVKYGIEALDTTKRLGIRAIFRESRIEKAGVYEIGFVIAPRLNAAGRITHAIDSLRLICTRNFYKANELALSLGRINQKRQKIVDEVLLKAEEKAKDNKNKIIMVWDETFHEGVIGLAAGKITEKYFRPSIVLSTKEGVAKASARSILGFDIISAIKKLNNLIIEGGGHAMAAGFSIKTENIGKFEREINKIADEKLKIKDLVPKLKIDAELEFNQINQDLVELLKKFEPFGQGNPQPVFLTKRVKVVEIKKVGLNGKHLKMKLEKKGKIFDAIWFNALTTCDLKTTSKTNVVYSVEENIFNGNRSIQFKIKDLKDC